MGSAAIRRESRVAGAVSSLKKRSSARPREGCIRPVHVEPLEAPKVCCALQEKWQGHTGRAFPRAGTARGAANRTPSLTGDQQGKVWPCAQNVRHGRCAKQFG